jgi:hypothetical protein
MMSYNDWLARIIQAAQDIASREFQQQAWFAVGGQIPILSRGGIPNANGRLHF